MSQQALVANGCRAVKLLFVLTLIVISGFYGCSSKIGSSAVATYNANPFVVPIPSGLSPDAVRSVLVETFVGRGWKVRDTNPPNAVVADLNHRQYAATVTFEFNESVVTILCKATHINEDTGEVRPAVPLGWLENLRKDLPVRLHAGG